MTMLYESNPDLYRTWWKKARPVTQGYKKCYQAKTPAGDLLQAEFNFHEGLVRLNLDLSDGSSYSSVIKKGNIIRERDVLHSIHKSVRKKIHPFRMVFASIPDKDLIDAIGGMYEIVPILPGTGIRKDSSEKIYEEDSVPKKKRVSFRERLRGFLRPKFSRERVIDELHDAVLGASLGAILYLHYFDYIVVGSGLAFLGIMFGGMDWVIRGRNPLIMKVLIFLSLGSYFFYTGYTEF